MSLLLKSLQRIDSRMPPAVAEPEETIVPAPIALSAKISAGHEPGGLLRDPEPALTVPLIRIPAATAELPSDVPESPAIEVDSEEPAEETAIAEEAVADVFDPVELLRPIESISLDALFAVPFEMEQPKLIEPSPPPRVGLSSPVLLMTATVHETVSDESPVVAEPELNIETALEEINDLRELLTAEEIDDVNVSAVIEPVPVIELSQVIEPPPVIETTPVIVPSAKLQSWPPHTSLPHTSPPQPLKLSDEYRELRDHFLSRFPLESHSTLLLVDAGRMVTDVAWLTPFVASLLEHLNARRREPTLQPDAKFFTESPAPPTALLIEAAGPDCGLARSFGLDVNSGLSEVLRGDITWKSAIQATNDPQIQLLGRGSSPLPAGQSGDLATLCADLKKHFDLLIAAAGPLDLGAAADRRWANSAVMFLPLASAAILCVELDGTPQPTAAAAKRQLDQSGVSLLGCIVRGDSAAA